jgi:hypothetical protein
MTPGQWQIFTAFRDAFYSRCSEWNDRFADELKPLQLAAARKDTPEYPVETAVVYNTALDTLTAESEISLIVIGDNPGKNEQLKKNNAYLVGQSGKIAAGFFARNSELSTDFRKNVIILNKTPVHTAKTGHLRELSRHGSPAIAQLISESQIWMAEETARLHQQLCTNACDSSTSPPQLWLVGYSELKKNGLFMAYRNTLYRAYHAGIESDAAWQNVFVYQHFSMNCFTRELYAYQKKEPETPLKSLLATIGHTHRDELFIQG